MNQKKLLNSLKAPVLLMAGLFILATLPSCDLSPSSRKVPGSKMPSSNFTKVSYSALPGWEDDDVRYALQAFRNSCRAKIQYVGELNPNPELFKEKCETLPSPDASTSTVRAWFESHFQPYQIYNDNGTDTGLFTGYYSPTIKGCRTKTAHCDTPLMSAPTDGREYKGVEKETIVKNKIGNVLYWANIVDVQDIQIQGSGLVELENGERVKLNFGGTNDMTFKSVAQYLKDRNIKPEGGYSAEALWSHLRARPELAYDAINSNPRYVYFTKASSHDVIGKIGTPLSKIRSIAMDDELYTIGLPVYIDTKLSNGQKFQRLMIAQDTGSAITGWIRADIFFGSGTDAYQYAQGQHQQGRMFILMPKEYTYVQPD